MTPFIGLFDNDVSTKYGIKVTAIMKNESNSLQELLDGMSPELQLRTKLSVAIANRIEALMRAEGLTKKQFAESLGRRPSEITKWLSGEHNFTIATLAKLGAFFGKSIISISH